MPSAGTSAGALPVTALKALARRSDGPGLAHLAGHLALLGATGAWVALATGTPWIAPALGVHGVILVFLFAPLHETIHRTAFRARGLNDAVAWVCGALLALPPVYFRAFHFAHHRYTQDPARDPELTTPKPRTLAQYLVYVSGVAYWRRQLGGLAQHAMGRVDEPFIAPRQRPAVVREARVLLAAYGGLALGSIVLGSVAVLVYWLIPVALGQPFLRMYLLAEHTGCPHVPDMLANSRTTRSNRAMRLLAWNMPYHAEHHAYPALPFHALPGAHDMLAPLIRHKARGYIQVQRHIVGAFWRRGAPAIET